MQDFDHNRLEEFDGKEGRPSYVAVHGKVYDLSGSKLWKNGKHMERHLAGRDLSEALPAAPHGNEVLQKFNQVGELKTALASKIKATPDWASRLLKLHPHPISVHFPQALLTLAPLFLILFYLSGNVHFERTCYYLAVVGWVTAIPTILTGFFHWVFKYAKSTKGIYIFKMSMSILLFVYTPVVIYAHSTTGMLSPEPIDALIMILYLLLIPIAAATGHAGGKIVFG